MEKKKRQSEGARKKRRKGRRREKEEESIPEERGRKGSRATHLTVGEPEEKIVLELCQRDCVLPKSGHQGSRLLLQVRSLVGHHLCSRNPLLLGYRT